MRRDLIPVDPNDIVLRRERSMKYEMIEHGPMINVMPVYFAMKDE